MRHTTRIPGISALIVFALTACLAGAAHAENRASITLVFQDGHRQKLDMSEIARIEFKTPLTIVFKDGHQQSISPTEIARIEFEPVPSAPSRNQFVGKWEVGQGNGDNFYITLDPDGEAAKTHGSSHGTWNVVAGEARITWDDGWHDAIRKVGAKHEKFAYEPGKSFDDPPTNVAAARNAEPKPI